MKRKKHARKSSSTNAASAASKECGNDNEAGLLQAGDTCMAVSREDGLWYKATLEDIFYDEAGAAGGASVVFEGSGLKAVVLPAEVVSLKEAREQQLRTLPQSRCSKFSEEADLVVGEPCMAYYERDGLWYPAIVKQINAADDRASASENAADKRQMILVQYAGFSEEKFLPAHLVSKCVEQQQQQSGVSQEECSESILKLQAGDACFARSSVNGNW